jgi:type VI secretion system protein ImpH
VQTSFLVRVGPFGLDQFRKYLPEGSRFAPLSRLVRYYAGFEYVISVQLLLNTDEAPAFRLGGTDSAGVRLGWESWLEAGSTGAQFLDDVHFTIGA